MFGRQSVDQFDWHSTLSDKVRAVKDPYGTRIS